VLPSRMHACCHGCEGLKNLASFCRSLGVVLITESLTSWWALWGAARPHGGVLCCCMTGCSLLGTTQMIAFAPHSSGMLLPSQESSPCYTTISITAPANREQLVAFGGARHYAGIYGCLETVTEISYGHRELLCSA